MLRKCHKILIYLRSNLFAGITTLKYTTITLTLLRYLRSSVVRGLSLKPETGNGGIEREKSESLKPGTRKAESLKPGTRKAEIFKTRNEKSRNL